MSNNILKNPVRVKYIAKTDSEQQFSKFLEDRQNNQVRLKQGINTKLGMEAYYDVDIISINISDSSFKVCVPTQPDLISMVTKYYNVLTDWHYFYVEFCDGTIFKNLGTYAFNRNGWQIHNAILEFWKYIKKQAEADEEYVDLNDIIL